MERSLIATREKIWPERNTEEKLDALRAQCVVLTQMVRAQSNQISKLLNHQHSKSGVLMTVFDGQTELPNYIPMALREKE